MQNILKMSKPIHLKKGKGLNATKYSETKAALLHLTEAQFQFHKTAEQTG